MDQIPQVDQIPQNNISKNSMSYDQKSYILACIPAFNESKRIGDIITKAKKYASEVIVYDDGSIDDTTQVARNAGAIVIRNSKNKGYGAAIMALFKIAKEKNADVMVTLDSDGQHDAQSIPDVIKPILTDGIDIVIGSRFLTDQDKLKVPIYRSIGIKTITRFTRSASYNNITDAQSGFRAYSNNALSKIDLFEQGMAVSTEILFKAKEKDLVIKEVPITIRYDLEETSTHNLLSHGVGLLYSIIQFISIRHPLVFYGLPGIILLIISALFMSKALELFSATRFVSTNMILISMCMALIGVVLLSTGSILHTLTAILKGKIKEF